MFLSVIIPTRNRSGLLEKALASLISQAYPIDSWEVIVVDNGSTDDTRAVCEAYKNKLGNLQYAYDDRPGLHVGRHVGMNAAGGDILVYGDDDIEAMPTWLESVAKAFKDDQTVLVGGKVLPLFETPPPPWLKSLWEKPRPEGQVLAALSILDFGDHVHEISPFRVYGCNFSIRKAFLLTAGGFHPDGMPKDLLRFRGDGESHISGYIAQKGYKTCYHPGASVYHFVPESRMTEKYFCERAFKQGISDSYRDIRNAHLNPETGISAKKYLKRLKSSVGRVVRKKRPITPLEKKIKGCYAKGYAYHQREVKKDHQLLAWVIKNNYLISVSEIEAS